MRVESKLGWAMLFTVIFVLLVAFVQTYAYGQMPVAPFLVAGIPPAGIGFDAPSTSSVGTGGVVTWNHTVGTNTNRILVIGLDIWWATTPPTTVTVTVGGTSITQLTNQAWNYTNKSYVFYVLNPAQGVTGCVAQAEPGTGVEIMAAGISFYNVVGTGTFGTVAKGQSYGTSASQAVTSATDELVIEWLAFYNVTPSSGAGQTRRATINNGSSYASVLWDTEPGATSVTASWTFGANSPWGTICVPMRRSAP